MAMGDIALMLEKCNLV